ncbi:MAG: hypothetical protein AAFX75_14600 [Pseudomonadota bacterium]
MAYELGLTPSQFESLLERDEKAAFALERGLAQHEQLLVDALTSQAVGDDETRGVTQAANTLLEKVHGKQPEQVSAVTIVLPDALSLDEYIKRSRAIEIKPDE